MKRAETNTVARFTLLLLFALSALSVPAHGQDLGTSQVTGKGSVSLSQRGVTGAGGERRFNLQFQPDDTAELFTGSLRVTGADGFNGGSLGDAEWELDGPQLTGKVVQRGMTVATFEGTVGVEETSGTFTTPGGRTGAWTWEGPPPGQ
jgi:hypothetical protein